MPVLKRILIVDDEQPARDKLRRLLGQCEGGAGFVLDEARDGVEAIERVAADRPDLVFLDIQMPEVSGLDVAASLAAPAPAIVFVTAFDQYAVAAFDANAIDYLLKPYDLARLQRALERVRLRTAATTTPTAATAASESPVSPVSPLPPQRLLITERGVTRVLAIADIDWIETADNYVVLHCADRHPLLRQSLAALLDNLGPRFVRCHRRAAVQCALIEHVVVNDKGDGELLLRGGARAPCSRQYRAEVMARLAGLA